MDFDQLHELGVYRSYTNGEHCDSMTQTALHLTSEAMIVRIASHADRDAYAQLFSIYAPKIKAFVMGQGLTGPEAEDLAQDVLLTVWRKAAQFDANKASAATWIYTIARNLRIDRARKQKRTKDLPEDLWAPEPDKGADQMLIEQQSANQITQLLDHLPSAQFEVLRLAYFENLSHSEISKSLSLPLGTVKSRIRLSLNLLKNLMTTPKGHV